MRQWGHFLLLGLLFGGMAGLWSWRGGESAYFLLIATAVLLLNGIGTALFSLRGLAVESGAERTRLYAGEAQHVVLRLRHRSIWPTPWLVVQMTWQHSDGSRVTGRQLLFPWLRRELELRYRLEGLKRGEYKSAGVELFTGDLLGLVQVKRQRAGHGAFLVYPQPLETGLEWDAPSREEDDVIGRRPSFRDSGLVRGVRDYEAGDPLPRIHWKLSARSGGLKTKTFEPAGTDRVVFWLDTAASSYGGNLGSGPAGAPLFETAVRAAAGLVRRALAAGHGAVTLRSTRREPYPLVLGSLDDLPAGFEWLARLQPDNQGGPFGDHLLRESLRVPLQLPLVLVTPLWGEALTPAVRQLRHAGRACTVVFVHAEPALTWPERQWKRELEAMGCRVLDLRAGAQASAGETRAAAIGGAVDGIA